MPLYFYLLVSFLRKHLTFLIPRYSNLLVSFQRKHSQWFCYCLCHHYWNLTSLMALAIVLQLRSRYLTFSWPHCSTPTILEPFNPLGFALNCPSNSIEGPIVLTQLCWFEEQQRRVLLPTSKLMEFFPISILLGWAQCSAEALVWNCSIEVHT